MKPSNLRLQLWRFMVLCVAWTVTCGAPPRYFSLTNVYIAFASFPLVSEACLCVLISLSFFSSPLKTWKDSCKSLHLCFSWIKVVFLSPIFMISRGWYCYRQQICWRNPCMSLIVVLVKFIISATSCLCSMSDGELGIVHMPAQFELMQQ